MTLNPTEQQIANIINLQLSEMVDNILANHSKNQINRGNNPFNCFKDPYIKNYMGMGRSFDSQLGNRLQNIALAITRLDPNKYAPTHFIFYVCNNTLYISSLNENNSNQFIRITETPLTNTYDFTVQITPKQHSFLMSMRELYKIKGQIINIPVDLIYYDRSASYFCAFELKSGGNLDTKNSDANYNEVNRLTQLLAPFYGSRSFFATCYNNMGEGFDPQGSIFNRLHGDQLLIGSDFWRMLLPPIVSYDRFIEIYQHTFNNIVQVDSRLRIFDY